MKRCLKAAFVLLLLATGLVCAAESVEAPRYKPFLFPLFNSRMVFPREVSAPVWGWAAPGEKVTVSMAGKSGEATADATGRWEAKLGPFPAGGPHKLTVAGAKRTVVLEDVLVGDVWFCSGQSNMTMGINKINDAASEVAGANYPNLRFLDIPPWRAEAANTGWQVCKPETVSNCSFQYRAPDGTIKTVGFSAAAYFFGRDLQKALQIPIGLVQTSGPGTFIEMWMPKSALASTAEPDCAAWSAWSQRNDAEFTAASAPGFDDSGWEEIVYPVKSWKTVPSYRGVLHLRKTFDAPAGFSGKPLELNFGWLGGPATFVLNGRLLGRVTPEGRAVIPGDCLKEKGNVLAVSFLNLYGRFGFAEPKGKLLFQLRQDSRKNFAVAGAWKFRKGRAQKEFDTPFPAPRVRVSDYAAGGGGMFRSLAGPLFPFAFKGVLWYQGEANKSAFAVYPELLSGLINAWRGLDRNPQLPFVVVLIADFVGRGSRSSLTLPALRAAQLKVAGGTPGVFISSAADLGEEKDEHPKNKRETGRRAALAALGGVYGRPVVYGGPEMVKTEKAGATMRVLFRRVDGGFLPKDAAQVKGFQLAGKDGVFHPASAVYDGATVVLTSAAVPVPEYVRYGWKNFGACDLYNGEKLPAVPFRTDSLPITK